MLFESIPQLVDVTFLEHDFVAEIHTEDGVEVLEGFPGDFLVRDAEDGTIIGIFDEEELYASFQEVVEAEGCCGDCECSDPEPDEPCCCEEQVCDTPQRPSMEEVLKLLREMGSSESIFKPMPPTPYPYPYQTPYEITCDDSIRYGSKPEFCTCGPKRGVAYVIMP